MDSFIHRTKNRLKRTKIELDELYPMDTFSGSFDARIPSENANEARNPGFLRKTCMDSFIHRTKTRKCHRMIELDEVYRMNAFPAQLDASMYPKSTNQNAKTRFFVVKPIAIRPQHVSNKLIHLCRQISTRSIEYTPFHRNSMLGSPPKGQIQIFIQDSLQSLVFFYLVFVLGTKKRTLISFICIQEKVKGFLFYFRLFFSFF